jgi:MraZ protein
VKRRMWIGAATLPLLSLIGVVLALTFRGGRWTSGAASAEPGPTGPAAVSLHAPETAPGEKPPPDPPGTEPRADLLQPVPAPREPDTVRRVTVARWPLGAPANREPPPPSPAWSRPQPIEPPSQGAVRQTASAPLRPVPAATGPVQPMPPLAAAPTSRSRPVVVHVPFTGTYPCLLDEGHALLLPKPVRQQIQAEGPRLLFCTPGPDRSLWLYTAASLEDWREQLGQADASAGHIRSAQRLCLAQTAACAVEHGGRLRVPEQLLTYADLRQDVVLIGVGDHLELWDSEAWQEYRQHKGMTATQGASRAQTGPPQEGAVP